MSDSTWSGDFERADPADPDSADETCRVCGEPASFAIDLDAAVQGEFAATLMLCKVCEYYAEGKNLDSLIARSSDASAETDRLAEVLIGHRSQATRLQPESEDGPLDTWD